MKPQTLLEQDKATAYIVLMHLVTILFVPA